MQRNTKDGLKSENGSRVVPVATAARELSVSPRTIWRLLAKGELEKVQIGRAVRIKITSIEAFLDRGGEK